MIHQAMFRNNRRHCGPLSVFILYAIISEISGASTMSGLYLAVAIVSEVIGTMNVKLSNGFTRWQHAAIAILCYALSTVLLSLAVKKMEVSVAYAIWCAVGTGLIAAIGVIWFKESL